MVQPKRAISYFYWLKKHCINKDKARNVQFSLRQQKYYLTRHTVILSTILCFIFPTAFSEEWRGMRWTLLNGWFINHIWAESGETSVQFLYCVVFISRLKQCLIRSFLQTKETYRVNGFNIVCRSWIDVQLCGIFLSVSVSFFSLTRCAAAVALSSYMFPVHSSLLLEAVKSHSGKYRKLQTSKSWQCRLRGNGYGRNVNYNTSAAGAQVENQTVLL